MTLREVAISFLPKFSELISYDMEEKPVSYKTYNTEKIFKYWLVILYKYNDVIYRTKIPYINVKCISKIIKGTENEQPRVF